MSEEQEIQIPEELLEEQQGAQGEMVGLVYFMSEDEVTKSIIANTYPELLPLHSRLHSLTYIDKAELKALKFKINAIVALKELSMEDDKYDEQKHLTLVSIAEHLKLRLNDSLRGRKLRALTEQTRVVEMRMGTAQRRRWFW